MKNLFNLLIIFLSVSFIAYKVYASFSAHKTNGPQSFQTGYINLSNSNGSIEQSWYGGNLKPEQTVSYLITVNNNGNIPIKLLDTSFATASGALAQALSLNLSAVGGWNNSILPGFSQDVRVNVLMYATASASFVNQAGTVTTTIKSENVY